MNSTKASSVKRRYSSAPFFGFTLDHSKHQFALYLIIVLITMVLPCLFTISRADLRPSSVSARIMFVEDTMGLVIGFGFIASFIIAVFSGMSALSYVNSKKAVGCYHSLPIRRESIFISETLTRVIFYLISIVIGYLVAYFMMVGAVPQGVIYTEYYLKYALSAVIIYMYVYSVILVAAGLCGTGFMRFAMSGIIAFLPCITYLLVFSTISMGVENSYALSATYQMNTENMKYAFSFIRVIDALMRVEDSMREILIVIPESILYYVIALFLHKYRRSEQSETTVIWKPVFLVVKYILMIAASLLGMYVLGMLFGGNDALGIFIGALIGLVVAFITVNSIMYRSSRMMFNGIKSFAMLTLVMLVYIVFVPLNITGRLGTPYSVENTNSLTIYANDKKIEYTDKEDVDMLLESLEVSLKDEGVAYPKFSGILASASSEAVAYYFEKYMYFDQNKYDGTEYLIPYASDLYDVVILQDPKIGINLKLSYSLDIQSEFFDAVWSTEEYADAYNFSSLREEGYVAETINIDFCSTNYLINSESYEINGNTKEANILDSERLAILLSHLELQLDKVGDSPLVGMIKLSCRKGEKTYRTFEYPIYADDTEVVLATTNLTNMIYNDTYGFYQLPIDMENIDEYYKTVTEVYTVAAMVHTTTGESKLMTMEDMASLAPYTVNFGDIERTNQISKYMDISESEYMIIAKRRSKHSNYNELCEIRFRDGAISEEELSAIFAELEQ